MYRFRFLSAKDSKKIVALLNGRIAAWIKNWTFSSEFSLSLRAYSSDQFQTDSTDSFEKAGAKNHLAYCHDAEFNWASFLLKEYIDDCPRDKLLVGLIEQAKKSFFLDVFEFNRSEDQAVSLPTTSAFSDAISIELVVADVGKLSLCVRQSTLYTLLNEPASKPTRSKLSGRFSAIENLKIHAEVSTSLGQVSFLELVNLADTKLLQSASGIDNRFKFNINGLPICDAALGKVGTLKAVLVQEISQ
jgi:hypothetical protein